MNVSYFFLVWLLGIFKLHLGLHLWLTLYFYWTAQASCNVSYCFVTFIPNRMLTGLLFAGWSSRLVARVPESPPCSPHHLSATLAWAPSSGWASHTVLCTEPSYSPFTVRLTGSYFGKPFSSRLTYARLPLLGVSMVLVCVCIFTLHKM